METTKQTQEPKMLDAKVNGAPQPVRSADVEAARKSDNVKVETGRCPVR